MGKYIDTFQQRMLKENIGISIQKLKNIIKKNAFNSLYDDDFLKKDYVYKYMMVSDLIPTQTFGTETGRDKIKKLISSITKNGVLEPIIVDEYNKVINGNHRLEAVTLLNIEYIPVLQLIGDGELNIFIDQSL